MDHKKLYRIAFSLAVFTIIYNALEGILASWLGYEHESLALFGFGSDSFIEMISGIGIAHMIVRIQNHGEERRDRFEQTALKITGVAFFLLVITLVVTAVYNLIIGHEPKTTFFGVMISSISIVVMIFLYVWKKRVGNQLNSAPILADAACTLTCIYMSIILLVSSGIFELTGIAWVDSVGTLGLAYFAWVEGRECFEKASKDHLRHIKHPKN